MHSAVHTMNLLKCSHGGLNPLRSQCREHHHSAPTPFHHVHLWLCPCDFAGLGRGLGGGAGRYGSEPPSPTVWRREPEAAPDTLLPGPGLPLPVDLEPACPEEAGRMHTGQTGTETSRVNWAEGASSRLNLATPFPSGSLGTPSSFQLSADSQCAGVWRGPESGWAHPGSWPPAAGQPEPIGFSVSISALGNGVPWAVKESEEEALERAGASLPPPYAEKAGTPKFPAAPLGGLG